jgi:hypothetical protein
VKRLRTARHTLQTPLHLETGQFSGETRCSGFGGNKRICYTIQSLSTNIWGKQWYRIGGGKCALIMPRMTRARTRTHGLGNPPLIQLWLEAALCVFVSLVQGAATTLWMIFKPTRRDWHTETAQQDLPRATSGISSKGPNSTHGLMLGPVPSISVGTPRGLTNAPPKAINRGARHWAERDSVDVAPTRMEANKVRVPRMGRGPALRAAQNPANRAWIALRIALAAIPRRTNRPLA